MTVALIPGSFDPFHNGHLEVVERAVNVFDEIVVAALRNPQKAEAVLHLEERREMIAECLAHLDHVRIVSVSTLLVNVAEEVGATAIVKGLRAVSDFESELQMAQMNRSLSGVETVFIPTSSSHSFIASRLLARGRALRRRREPVRARAGREAPPRALRGRRDVTYLDDRGPRPPRRPRPGGQRAPERRRDAAAPRDRGRRERQGHAAVELGARSRATRCSGCSTTRSPRSPRS